MVATCMLSSTLRLRTVNTEPERLCFRSAPRRAKTEGEPGTARSARCLGALSLRERGTRIGSGTGAVPVSLDAVASRLITMCGRHKAEKAAVAAVSELIASHFDGVARSKVSLF